MDITAPSGAMLSSESAPPRSTTRLVLSGRGFMTTPRLRQAARHNARTLRENSGRLIALPFRKECGGADAVYLYLTGAFRQRDGSFAIGGMLVNSNQPFVGSYTPRINVVIIEVADA